MRDKLAELYKCEKDQVSCFGFRTQYGGGKSTGFALIYDSAERMKHFEPRYRLIRWGMANKIEKPSRQQRESCLEWINQLLGGGAVAVVEMQVQCLHSYRQTAQEPLQGIPRYGEDQGCRQGQEEISGSLNVGALQLRFFLLSQKGLQTSTDSCLCLLDESVKILVLATRHKCVSRCRQWQRCIANDIHQTVRFSRPFALQ